MDEASVPDGSDNGEAASMLDTLISNKTRVKLLIRFFLNPDMRAYLRGLEKEFGESSNSVRLELNRFEEAKMIFSEREGNRKYYRANEQYPLFQELRQIAMKHFGVDHILDKVILKIGKVDQVYLIGTIASGLDAPIIDLALIGDDIDKVYLLKLTESAEEVIERKIRYLVLNSDEIVSVPEPKTLIYCKE